MKAGKTNDSPVAIFTIDHNYICLNSALAKCLLDAAVRAIDHVPQFPPGQMIGLHQSLPTAQY